ncbi:Uncharacterized protein Rs2_20025 [Raphanus sativus]|nr:Uncharacterized protein Rs2_20025 [Raphanus sativus]
MTLKIGHPKTDQRLNQTLRPILQTPFLKKPAKDFKRSVKGSRGELVKRGSAFFNKSNSNLEGVSGGLTKKHVDKLECDSLTSDSLVHEMGEEFNNSQQKRLVVAFVSPLDL